MDTTNFKVSAESKRMVFKLDPVALVLDTFTFGIWSGYWNIQRIIKSPQRVEYGEPTIKRSILWNADYDLRRTDFRFSKNGV